LANYTIGQRKGLRIASPVPLYVINKDTTQNSLLVGPVESLGSTQLTAKEVNWISNEIPSKPFRAQVKIRYKSQDEFGTISMIEADRIQIQFDRPLRDITPGQAVVFYDNEVCLGGGIIEPHNSQALSQE
jgi:tRNA-specific 2-thiouridylase